MVHRIREAMNPAEPSPLGGEGKVVEIGTLTFEEEPENISK